MKTLNALYALYASYALYANVVLEKRAIVSIEQHYYRETEEQNSNGCKRLVKKDAMERSYDNSANGTNLTIRKYCLRNCLVTGGPSSRLEKKPTINSRTRHAFCDSVLSNEKNRRKFEHVIGNSIGNEKWSIYNDKYFKILTLFS
ncbi:hypothetical protein pdam_00020419 [Pocillopora damicornis]|uniref:Uncharacterized protein n=1 Tax=Pocillopora damicornis TaxID=46731 RepID=A0A3M6TMB0_POCDA|nr:hypothetical protein pdam_00020419 [Pocillopora damicornis]